MNELKEKIKALKKDISTYRPQNGDRAQAFGFNEGLDAAIAILDGTPGLWLEACKENDAIPSSCLCIDEPKRWCVVVRDAAHEYRYFRLPQQKENHNG